MDEFAHMFWADVRGGSAAAEAPEAVRYGRRHGLVEGGDVGAEDGAVEKARDGRFGPLGALGLGDQPVVERIAGGGYASIWGYSSGGR